MAIRALLSNLFVTLPLVLSAVPFAAVFEKGPTNWPMLGGTPQRNMVNTVERNMPTEWDLKTKKNIKWVAALGSTTYGNPIVADGKVFIGTNNGAPRNPKITGDKGILMCFRQSDGEFLWQAMHDKLSSGREHDYSDAGICSTPAVEGKRLYYVSNRCELVCADTEGFYDGNNDGVTDEKYRDKTDADIIWRLDMLAEFGVSPRWMANSSPLVVGDLVYVLTSNGAEDGGFVPAPDAPSFIAVNKRTGKVAWTDSSPGDRIYDGQWSSPAYGEVNGKGQVYFPGGDGWLYAFEPLGDQDHPGKGKLIWKFDCNPPGSKWVLLGRGTANQIVATPVFHDNKVFIGVGMDPQHGGGGTGHLYAIDATKAGDVSEYLGEWDAVDRVKKNGRKNPNSALVWHYGNADFGRTISGCAIHEGLLLASELAGILHCLDVKTGRPLWKYDLLAETWGSPYIVDNKIYIGDTDGDMAILELSEQQTLQAEIQMGAQILGTPVASDGVLYIATPTHLYAIEQK